MKLSCFLNKEDMWWLEKKMTTIYLCLFRKNKYYYLVLCYNVLIVISSFVQVSSYFYLSFTVYFGSMVWSAVGDRCFWTWWCLSSCCCLSACCDLPWSATGISRNAKTEGNPTRYFPSDFCILFSQMFYGTALLSSTSISQVDAPTTLLYPDFEKRLNSASPPTTSSETFLGAVSPSKIQQSSSPFPPPFS